MVEVDNRLEKITQDIVFKIKIDDLVCEFQMVLHFNEAENTIHHKMYELTRSKLRTPFSLLFEWAEKSFKEYEQFIKSNDQSEKSKEELNKVK